MEVSCDETRPVYNVGLGFASINCRRCRKDFVESSPKCTSCVGELARERALRLNLYEVSGTSLYEFLMECIGEQVTNRARMDARVRLAPCTLSAFSMLRERMLRSRCPPGVQLSIPPIAMTRGANSAVMPKEWKFEVTEGRTCSIILASAFKLVSPPKDFSGLVRIFDNGSVSAVLPPLRFRLTAMCPLGDRRARASLSFDTCILTRQGGWIFAAEDWPNQETLKHLVALDVVALQRRRLMMRQGGEDDVPELPQAQVQAALLALPEEEQPDLDQYRQAWSPPPRTN